MSAHAAAGNNLVSVLDLFTRFNSICGACHGPAADPPGLGSFRIASDVDFQTLMTPAILAHVTSNGGPQDSDPMPPFASPAGGPYSKRSPTDPIAQFVTLVQAWLAAGSPQSFTPPQAPASDQGADGGDGGATTNPYLMTPATGNALTNIGNCIPNGQLMTLAATQKKGSDLDAMFAGLSKKAPGPGVTPAQLVGLPEHLRDTDLFTFDSSVLAQYGVTAFQPAYPLWSDDAGKLRHVRVPIGQSIQFDKTKQEFVIPDNTRFYKTFMKRMVDTDGSIRWRKIETRLILARHDKTQNADGTPADCSSPGACVNALFGSYQWNADESDAVLIETPLIDGLPFADTMLLYTGDEQLAADLLSQNPPNPDEVLVRAGAARHYAIPSSDRCIQCHMGSPSESFVLGFRPVQINRRPPGSGGILTEPNQQAPTADELTQLQRFIDYGIITGMTSPADVLPLEQSEGSRQPRNLQELNAQGYMVGNCAHCHNPRGFPSVTNPVLTDVFNLLPGPNGGIFQFDLQKTSPRITRGLGGGTQVPYITPSLMDLSSSAKYNSPSLDNNGNPGATTVAYAPWRSLIYRNTDTPFTYTDDYGLFPHMPMNAPGFDCRTKQIMSDWMVSIPAIRKHPEIPEYALKLVTGDANVGVTQFLGGNAVDDTPQPYVEVAPGAPGYDAAVTAAQQRLQILHTGVNPAITSTYPYVRYSDCPDNSDILDPEVLRDPTCHPVPTVPDVGDNGSGYHLGVPLNNLAALHVPAHAHWVVTDLTQIAGNYSPRRADWASIVVDQKFAPVEVACQESNLTDAQNAQDEVKLVVRELQIATLDQVREFNTKNFPMGLWQVKPGCNFPTSVPTLGSFTGSQRLQWMDHAVQASQASPSDPVYAEWPGAAVFNLICVNCHGPLADAHGRLSDNLLQMTGGNARVADLRDGLFGPVSMPGANRQGPFGMLPSDADAGWTSTSIDDRAARYMAWMGAGGTEVTIPEAILQIVSNTAVLGVTRQLPSETHASANMLSVAKSLCFSLLFGNAAGNAAPTPGGEQVGFPVHNSWYLPDMTGLHEADNAALITANGDAELWLRLCSVANPPPVRAIHGSLDANYKDTIPVGATGNDVSLPRFYSTDLFPQDSYGANPVGNDRGLIDQNGITADNLRPWCYRISSAGPNDTPVCPASIDNNGPAEDTGAKGDPPTLDLNTFKPKCTNGCWGADEADAWATRGAINAGFAVFLYLDAISKGKLQRLPDYNQCDQLP